MSAAVVVNGRFLTMQLTGVQRYSRDLVEHLAAAADGDVLVAVPPGHLVDINELGRLGQLGASTRWHGPAGHVWEQVVLPVLVRRAGGAPLLSPASWGPAAVRRQVVYIHDVLPRLHSQFFTAGYRGLFATLAPLLMRRCARVATPSASVADELHTLYNVPRSSIDVVPPGVGEPFRSWPLDDLAARPSTYCLIVGSHDRRKNARFVTSWWSQVHAELGLDLVVTTRGGSSVRFGDDLPDVPGMRVVVDPDDAELASLYAGALCLLWPSIAEGYGLPLLEAMAVGTPFLSTDTGAARELAVDPSQVLPLQPDVWIAAIRTWARAGIEDLREASATKAREYRWERSAGAAWASIRRLS